MAARKNRLRAAPARWQSRSGIGCGGWNRKRCQILFEFGLDPTVVDISPEMLERWAAKVVASGRKPQIIRAALEDFFDAGTMDWDLIVFSSAAASSGRYRASVAGRSSLHDSVGVILTVHVPIYAVEPLGSWRADWIPTRYCMMELRSAGRSDDSSLSRGDCTGLHVEAFRSGIYHWVADDQGWRTF